MQSWSVTENKTTIDPAATFTKKKPMTDETITADIICRCHMLLQILLNVLQIQICKIQPWTSIEVNIWFIQIQDFYKISIVSFLVFIWKYLNISFQTLFLNHPWKFFSIHLSDVCLNGAIQYLFSIRKKNISA